MIFMIRSAEKISERGNWLLRGSLAGLTLAALFVAGRALTGENVAITSGFSTVEWSLEPDMLMSLCA